MSPAMVVAELKKAETVRMRPGAMKRLRLIARQHRLTLTETAAMLVDAWDALTPEQEALVKRALRLSGLTQEGETHGTIEHQSNPLAS